LPHPPNFSPVAMIALFSGTYLTKKQALTIPLLIMILSDIFIGLHGLVWWTWGSFLLISLLGLWLKRHNKPLIIVRSAFLSSVLFFLVTNFGVWVSTNWYPPTLKGLINCFVMALPFLRNTLLGDFCYLGIFFGGYELVARLIRKVSWNFRT
jgi:hypothetical protein